MVYIPDVLHSRDEVIHRLGQMTYIFSHSDDGPIFISRKIGGIAGEVCNIYNVPMHFSSGLNAC